MGLEALHLLEGAQVRVRVVEPDDEAERNLIVLQVIDEGPAPGARVHRPAGGVHDQAGLVLGRIDLPQLLDADAVGLRIGLGAQIEALEQGLGQRAAAALREKGILAPQLHARREAVLLLAGLGDAHVAGGDALDPALVVIEHLGRGEARIDLRAQRLGLLGEPAADVAQRDDVVAMVVHLGRHEGDRDLEAALLGQEKELLVRDRRVQRCAPFLPVGEQLVHGARLHDRAREDVRPHFRAFFQNADRDVRAAFLGELTQLDRRRQASRPGPDDHHVVFHVLAFHRAPPFALSRPF